jgi:hypothetical protein
MKAACFLCVVLLHALAPSASAQDFRGAIEGTVTDASGGRTPGVTVTAVNVATNGASTTTTDNEGAYTLRYLTPGTYSVTAELSGFKKLVRENIEVRIGDRLALDLHLEVGSMEETVSVTAEAPLLDTANGSNGQVIDEKRISMMPLSDGNPFVLARLAPGVSFHGDLKFSRPFDNGGTSDFTADGGPGRNEFTLDGSPNMANGRRVAFVPPAGAVQEFKVETATFDAQQGHTAGATVNVTLKSGTNRFKGDAYYHYRDEALSGNDFFLERAGRPKDALDYKRYGFTIGGPAWLSKLYDGRDKTFFFGAFEWLYDTFPEPGQFTVPTEAQRRGDFSGLLAQGIVIYDPLTAVRRADNRIERQPFPGNIIPADRLSPIGQNYVNYYPLPNQPGDAQGRNNFLSTNSRGDDFYSMNYRVDQVLNDKQRLFVRYSRNNRMENRGNWTGEVNGIRPTGNFLFRINDAVNADHVWTMSNNSLLNVRGSYSRFQEPSIRQNQGIFDPTSLGFSSSASQHFGGSRYFPRFEMDDGQSYSDLGDSFAGGTTASIYSFQPTWTLNRGKHSFRSGSDLRVYREQSFPSQHAAGRYDFGRGGVLTRQFDNSPAAAIGQDLAAVLLGIPSGGTIDRNATRFNQVFYGGVFIQDDWRLTSKLTLNLGLRWEYEGAPTERENRNARGFDPNADLAIAAAAQAAYAQSPIPQRAASDFRVRGGLQFASADNRGIYNPDLNNFQPRVGFAYQMDPKTVVRGGWAIYSVPGLFDGGLYQPGFSQGTPIVPTLDAGLTVRATLDNPFPDGVATPPGSSNGPNTFVGRSIGRFSDDLDYRNGQSMRWSVSMQRELPGQFVADVAYVASRSYDLTTDFNANPVPREYLSTSPVRDTATINFLTANVANPFAGLLPGEGLNGSTTSRQQLLRPYPQFINIDTRRYDGSSAFDSAQLRLERRFRGGYTVLGAYTWSDFKERVTRLNETDPDYEERLNDTHLPHRLVLNGIWELPFGREARWGKDSHPVVNGILGNWSVSFIWNWQSGRPSMTIGNVYYDGDITKLETKYTKDPTQPVFDTSGFYFHDAAVQTNGVDDPAKQRADQRIQLANNIRTLPTRWDGLRTPRYTNWDMSFVKGLQLGAVRAQVHIELYNAFNDVFFNNPNLNPMSADFGKVSSQNNLPRNIQIGTKILF